MENTIIPAHVLAAWERDAVLQRVPQEQLRDFLRAKERIFLERKKERKPIPKVYANDAQNKLTEYGNSFVLAKILEVPVIERTCKIARYQMEDLQKILANGFKSDKQKESFEIERAHWFKHFKERMRDLRISKEIMQEHGLSWNDVKNFAFLTI